MNQTATPKKSYEKIFTVQDLLAFEIKSSPSPALKSNDEVWTLIDEMCARTIDELCAAREFTHLKPADFTHKCVIEENVSVRIIIEWKDKPGDEYYPEPLSAGANL